MSPPRPPRKRPALDPRVERVVAYLVEELKRFPRFTTGILQELASAIEPAIRDLDQRKFHTEYVVPAQLRIAKPRPKRKKRRPTKEIAAAGRDAATEPAPSAESPPRRSGEGSATRRGATARAAPRSSTKERTVGRRQAASLEPAAAAAAARATAPEARRSWQRRRGAAASPRKPAPTVDQARARVEPVGAGRGERRAVLRSIFLEWARSLASAESETQWVQAVMDVDRFVDRAVEVRQRGG